VSANERALGRQLVERASMTGASGIGRAASIHSIRRNCKSSLARADCTAVDAVQRLEHHHVAAEQTRCEASEHQARIAFVGSVETMRGHGTRRCKMTNHSPFRSRSCLSRVSAALRADLLRSSAVRPVCGVLPN
jgi:hypothetical protein